MKYYTDVMSDTVWYAPDWLDINKVNDTPNVPFFEPYDFGGNHPMSIESYNIFDMIGPDLFVHFRKNNMKLTPKPAAFSRFSKDEIKKIITEWKKNIGQKKLAEDIENNLDFLFDSASIADIIE